MWAGRRTGSMLLLDGVARVLLAVEWLRGGTTASIARAGGELPRGAAR